MDPLTHITAQPSQASVNFHGLILIYPQNQSLPYPEPSSCSMEKLEVKPSFCSCREGRVPQCHSPGRGGTDPTAPLRLQDPCWVWAKEQQLCQSFHAGVL